MDTQSKLLNKEYLETRLRDLSVIRKKEFSFKIHESDRALSKTLYVEFWQKDGESYFKQQTIRISDHWQDDCPHIQFSVKPYDFLTKQKKQQFLRTIENSIKAMRRKSLYRKLNKIGEEI
jgi:hypothetical protein